MFSLPKKNTFCSTLAISRMLLISVLVTPSLQGQGQACQLPLQHGKRKKSAEARAVE
jgi:hypothetical protein